MIRASTAAVLLSAAVAQAEEPSLGNKARTMLVHWECHTYARMMDKQDSYEKHFAAGLRDGNEFITALENDQITEEQFRSSVPVMVGLALQGPSKDFILGRLYELIIDYAWEKAAKRAETGPESLQYDTEPDLLKIKAGIKYDQANCELIE